MSNVEKIKNAAPLLERLAARGIGRDQYVEIKTLVTFNLPQAALFFQRQYPHRTPKQVLRQAEELRDLLDHDFILDAQTTHELEIAIARAELFAWGYIVDAATSQPVGPWRILRHFVPDANGAYIKPDTKLTAIHQETGELRVALVRSERPGTAAWADAWERAFSELGILEVVRDMPAPMPLASARPPRAWPIYTQNVIPRLYEFLLPYYRTRGHVWSERESVLTRDAHYPKDLFEDMAEILQVEHADVFDGSLKLDRLKSAIQRYLERRKSTESRKSLKSPKTVLPSENQ